MLEELGVNVTGRIPCIVESQEHNVGYLATKQVSTQWMMLFPPLHNAGATTPALTV